MPDESTNGNKKTKTQKAFDVSKVVMILGAFIGSLYTGMNSASDKQVTGAIDQINTGLVPELQKKLNQHSERIARLEAGTQAKFEAFEKMLNRLEEWLRSRVRRDNRAAHRDAKGAGVSLVPKVVEIVPPPQIDVQSDTVKLPKIKKE